MKLMSTIASVSRATAERSPGVTRAAIAASTTSVAASGIRVRLSRASRGGRTPSAAMPYTERAPARSGLDVVRAARAQGTPVIVMSGRTSHANRAQTLEGGAARTSCTSCGSSRGSCPGPDAAGLARRAYTPHS